MLNEHELKSRPEDQLEAFDINYSQWWVMYTMRDIFVYGMPTHALEMVWKNEHAAAENGMSLRCIEHHDTANDMYYNRVEKISSPKCEAALVLCYCIDGVPFIYNGCEYKDTSRHSIFGLKGQFTIDRSRDPSERMAFLRRLAEIHRTEKAILYGVTRWVAHDRKASVAAIVRSASDEEVFCAVNLSNENKQCVVTISPDSLKATCSWSADSRKGKRSDSGCKRICRDSQEKVKFSYSSNSTKQT